MASPGGGSSGEYGWGVGGVDVAVMECGWRAKWWERWTAVR